eukprot:3765319-Rhodomonas_salina.2
MLFDFVQLVVELSSSLSLLSPLVCRCELSSAFHIAAVGKSKLPGLLRQQLVSAFSTGPPQSNRDGWCASGFLNQIQKVWWWSKWFKS